MLSNKPYLIRAFYQWIIDSECTPILVLDANNPRCKVPMDYAEGGEIVFNISSVAIRDLKITNESIQFKASFSGVIHIISAPIKAVLAIYAEENGEGLFLDADETKDDDSDQDDRSIPGIVPLKSIDGLIPMEPLGHELGMNIPKEKSKPFLKLVE